MSLIRRRLPDRRRATTFDLWHQQKRYEITLGYYPDGSVGEVFVAGAKSGSDLDAMTRDAAILTSILLQYDMPLDVIRRALTREADGTASTAIGAILDELT